MRFGILASRQELIYLDVFGSFFAPVMALMRGLGARPVLQTSKPNGTMKDIMSISGATV